MGGGEGGVRKTTENQLKLLKRFFVSNSKESKRKIIHFLPYKNVSKLRNKKKIIGYKKSNHKQIIACDDEQK